jgi:ArsR family transcriptional regulator, arsenate/arsenite/antimonite-responsive transcriptional repressor
MDTKQAVDALAALAHEHRLNVYRLLVEAGPEGLNAGTIASRLKLAPSSLTFHLQQLHRAGLLTQQRNSRQLIYSADFTAMNTLVGYLTENCCAESGADCSEQCVPVTAVRKASKKSPRAA